MKIAVTSTSNMGKTTFIQDFLKEWPMYKTPATSYRDKIKELGLDINKNSTEDTQRLILNCLVDQATEFEKTDNVIMDRCVLDNLAYTSWLNLNGKVSDKFLDETRLITRKTLELFDIVFFFPMCKFNNIVAEENGVRDTDPVYREEIDAILKAFQESYNRGDGRIFPTADCPAFIELYGNQAERIKLTSLYADKDGKAFGADQSLISDISLPPEKQIFVP